MNEEAERAIAYALKIIDKRDKEAALVAEVALALGKARKNVSPAQAETYAREAILAIRSIVAAQKAAGLYKDVSSEVELLRIEVSE